LEVDCYGRGVVAGDEVVDVGED